MFVGFVIQEKRESTEEQICKSKQKVQGITAQRNMMHKASVT